MKHLPLNSEFDNKCQIGRVLIMESCQTTLTGINRFLSLPRFKVGQYLVATMATDIPAILARDKVDLVIMELGGQKESALDGLSVIKQLINVGSLTPLIVCTRFTDVHLLRQLAAIQVNGIYLKEESLSAFMKCIYQVMQGKYSYSARTTRSISDREDHFNVIYRRERVLTLREIVVLKYLFAGNSVTSTSSFLHRSIRTISAQKRSAMAKLSFASDYELYRWGDMLACNR